MRWPKTISPKNTLPDPSLHQQPSEAQPTETGHSGYTSAQGKTLGPIRQAPASETEEEEKLGMGRREEGPSFDPTVAAPQPSGWATARPALLPVCVSICLCRELAQGKTRGQWGQLILCRQLA